MSEEIIYEVALCLDVSIEHAYLDWLRPHIREILKLPGFISAELFAREHLGPCLQGKAYYTVRYTIADRASLDHYFATEAPKMREQAIERFGTKFSATRAVDKVLEQFSGP